MVSYCEKLVSLTTARSVVLLVVVVVVVVVLEMYTNSYIEGSVHKGSISRNPNFSGNEFLCFASFTS